MNWTLAVQLGLLAPVIASLGAMALAGAAGERAFPSLSCLAGAGILAAGAVAAVTGEQTEWREFNVNAWTGLLGAGALLCAAAACLRARTTATRAALALAAGIAVASVLSPNRAWLGVLIAATTLAHAVALAGEGRASRLRMRSFTIDAVSAVLILLGLALDTSNTIDFGDVDGWAGIFVVAGGLLRLGAFGVPADASWPVALRAQGAFVCAFAAMGEPGLVAPASVAAGLAALRLWLRPTAGGAEAAHLALVALGLGIGGAVATTGAALLLGAGFAATAISLSGAVTMSRAPLSLAPMGGTFLGAAMVCGAVGRLAAVRMPWLFAAIPALTAACVAVVAAWRIERDPGEHAPRMAAPLVVVAVGVLGLLAFAPAYALEKSAAALALAAGATSALSFSHEALTETAGLAIAALAVIGLAVGAYGAAAVPEREPPTIPPPLDITETEHPGLWGPAARLAGIAMVGCAVWLTLAVGNRGWL